MSRCFNCGETTPHMRFVTVAGKRYTICCNACANTLRGKCGEPWRWCDPKPYLEYIAANVDYVPEFPPRSKAEG